MWLCADLRFWKRKKCLTKAKIRDIITTKDEGKENPQKTRKEFIMKKSTLTTIYDSLKDMDYDPEILAELEKELNKGAEEKAQKAEQYEAVKGIVFAELSETPVTISELWDALGEELSAQGFTKGKLQYAMTRLWKDELTKVEGKVNGYKKA